MRTIGNAVAACLIVASIACPGGEPEKTTRVPPSAGRGGAAHGGTGASGAPAQRSGSFVALTYNVAGLPEGLSQSMPLRFTPIIGPLLNNYALVLLQESWQTPDPNPNAPTRVYHEILAAASTHPYKTEPAPQPLGQDPTRPSALLADGLNVFSDFPLGETQRVAWSTCVETASDCLALKGFSRTPLELDTGAEVDVYDLHMEAGSSAADDDARSADIDQLLAFIAEHSEGRALIVGGDFNLGTDKEPAASQFARLLKDGGLTDVCSELECAQPGNIDKILYRSSAQLRFSADAWQLETEVFVSPEGAALSDHAPLAVRLAWTVESR